MAHLGGIIHPTSFQMNELITSMQTAYPDQTPFFFLHKNLELVCFQEEINKYNHIIVLLDGTLTNKENLSHELEISSNNISEIIAHAYMKWGDDFVKKIEGNYAICLYDSKKENIYLYRDPLGKKQLYWSVQGDYFLFASELKGLLATGVVPQTPSSAGISSYFYFGFIPQDLSAVGDINKLLPGYYLKIDLNGRYSIEQFWSLSKSMEHGNTLPQHREMLIPEMIEGEPEDVLSDLISMVWKLDEPIADFSTLLYWRQVERAEDGGLTHFSNEKKYHSLPLFLASLPQPLRKYFVFPLTNFFAPDYKWRILRNIEINHDLMSYLSSHALFKGSERRWLTPRFFNHFDPEIFIERFHRLSRMHDKEKMIEYFNAKNLLPDSLLFQEEKLGNGQVMSIQEMLKFPPRMVSDEVIQHFCDSGYMRELFELLEEGVLVEQEIISPKWISHQLGFPHIVPKVFKKMWAILILEIWFRLYITHPIGTASFALTPDELLRT